MKAAAVTWVALPRPSTVNTGDIIKRSNDVLTRDIALRFHPNVITSVPRPAHCYYYPLLSISGTGAVKY